MHEFQTEVWIEGSRDVPSKASRPVLPVLVAHSLPAATDHELVSIQSVRVRESIHSIVTRSRSDQLGWGLCRVVWIFSIVRSSWRVKVCQVCAFHKLEALRLYVLHHVL